MEDITKLAGVSKSAVSFALSGKHGIRNETRERVLEIARENGYAPKPRLSANEGSGTDNAFIARISEIPNQILLGNRS
jgi:DNA-binding LacI/PurR family transcriptional regulator